MKKKQLKKIVVIGNGFDLAHGLKTSYKDFIDWIYYDTFKILVKSYFEKLYFAFDNDIKINFFNIKISDFRKKVTLGESTINNDVFNLLEGIKSYQNYSDIKEKLLNHLISKGYKNNNIGLYFDNKINNSILEKIIEKYNKTKNWSDIEHLYYFMLENSSEPKKLNDEFKSIKAKLIEYLKEESSKEVDKKDKFRRFFNTVSSNDLILNFNYTKTFSQYIGDKKCEVINIHGTLNDKIDDIIFGYGNYDFKEYEAIEESNDNEKLEYFKIFQYLNSDSYSKLFEFISDEEYEIVIIGHSCGLSDKSLLKTVFENEFCKKITFFYHQWENIETKDKEDNFKELTKNISRYFTYKSKMLGIVENKTKSYT
jgi:hypothetical protein